MLTGYAVLIVDDDNEIRELLETYLSQSGLKVSSAKDGASFKKMVTEDSFDLIILDIGLPDESGFSLCKWIRWQSNIEQIPVIMLTASSDDSDRIVGLEIGADDYIGKPFNPRELLARIKALLRRANYSLNKGKIITFEDWYIDIETQQLFDNKGEEVYLTGAEYSLLKLFLDNPQKVINRDTISEAIHGRKSFPLARSIDMSVSRLRQKLGDAEKAQRIIRSIRGMGYIFTAEVKSFEKS